jgi:small redox-active disulfide protein 2
MARWLAELKESGRMSNHEETDRMRIAVYGPGCANCKRLERQTTDALANIGLKAQVTKVEDVVAIAEAGVMRTPALGIDGQLVLQGRVPGVRELEYIIKKAQQSIDA